MRILSLLIGATLLAACEPSLPDRMPTEDPAPRPCPVGEPDCGPAGR